MMDNIYSIAALVRRNLIRSGRMTRAEASQKVSAALNTAEDYKHALANLYAL